MSDDKRDQSLVDEYKKIDLQTLPEESRKPEFGVSDVFFWRDAPDWYYKTFTSAGVMLSFSALKQYMERHELEVFLPPRAKVLPDNMRRGYRNREIFRLALYKTGMQTVVSAATAGIFFGGAYYLGKYREEHTTSNFVASGTAAGVILPSVLIRPIKSRTLAFCGLAGAAMGATYSWLWQLTGQPYWDERHDFQGWWWGKWVDLKDDSRKTAAAACASQGTAHPTAATSAT